MKQTIYFGLLIAGITVAGCSKYNKANYEYNQMAYYKAARHYTDYLQKHQNPRAMARLADSYRQIHDYAKAEYWYSKAYADPDLVISPEDKLAYATVLKANGKYGDAREWFDQYLAEVPGDRAAMAMMASCDSMESYNRNAHLYKTEPLGTNANVSSFGITPFENGYVYVTESANGSSTKTNPWNGRPYLNVVYAKMGDDGRLQNPQPFNATIANPYHTGPVAFSPTFDRIYFTRSNYDRKLRKGSDDVSHIKLYTARRNGNDWADIQELPFNGSEYSTGHPTVSADGNTIFFVSDRPGGLGKTDLYMSSLENGKWSEPKSLGSAVNTSGAEMFPYYYKGEDGTTRLYFSSDAREGMGGLDLYYTEQGPDGRWNAPVHMGAPFNSSKDDFGIIMTNSHAGYFASSRNGNGDVDQMFAFDKAPINLFVDGSVLNKNTRNNIINAQIVMLNKTTGKSQMLSSSQDGKFFAALDGNSEYSFNATHPRYLPGNAMATTFGKTVSETLQVQIFMDSTGYVLSLANIYYDFDNWNIRPDAAAQLDKLVPILLEHPEVTLALDAHADSRGSQQYNVELTKRRAQSVITYLYARGIDRKRLEAKWYGKSRPVNECKSGVACSPVKHQQNRRSEFKLVEDGKIIEGEWSGYKIQK